MPSEDPRPNKISRRKSLGKVTTRQDIFCTLGGLPFIDASFDIDVLISLIATKRAKFAKEHNSNSPTHYLTPQFACYALRIRTPGLPILPHWTSLSGDEMQRVGGALSYIEENWPEFCGYRRLPMQFGKWLSDRTSVTNPFEPQVVLLGNKAFRDDFTLVESLIHEVAHVWLGLVAELRDFQNNKDPGEFVLPSGTTGKTARGVVFAAHFAASVISFIRSSTLSRHEWWRPRAAHLQWYLAGCLELANLSTHLSITGLEITERLKAQLVPI